MKIILCLLALAACVLFSGCTAIAVRGPVGEPAPDDVVETLLGTWIGERVNGVDGTLVIERLPGSQLLVGRYKEDDEMKETRFLVTRVGDGVIVLWAETELEGIFAPGRAVLNESMMVVLPADVEAVKGLVAKGVLTAGPEDEDGLYILEQAGVAEAIATKEFWAIDRPLALINDQISQEEESEAAAGEADASPPQSPLESAKTEGAP